MTKDEARLNIIQTANAFKLRRKQRVPIPFITRLLSMRHIQEAVCIVRRNRLVDSQVLVDAGYKGYS